MRGLNTSKGVSRQPKSVTLACLLLANEYVSTLNANKRAGEFVEDEEIDLLNRNPRQLRIAFWFNCHPLAQLGVSRFS